MIILNHLYYSYQNWKFLCRYWRWRWKRYDTSNFEVDRPLPKGVNKKFIGLIKDKLRKPNITEFVALDQKHILT